MVKKATRVNEINLPLQERRREFYSKVDSGELSLRETVKQYRFMLGKTQAEFSKFVKVPLRTLRDFEQGNANPTLETIAKLLKGSGLEISARRRKSAF